MPPLSRWPRQGRRTHRAGTSATVISSCTEAAASNPPSSPVQADHRRASSPASSAAMKRTLDAAEPSPVFLSREKRQRLALERRQAAVADQRRSAASPS
ncbi:hypothetical protein ZWY2020_041398 [Hordeum vulgare]|nr:hypothetical protein ZWY2020_041398 [Hordeum vulgare]